MAHILTKVITAVSGSLDGKVTEYFTRTFSDEDSSAEVSIPDNEHHSKGNMSDDVRTFLTDLLAMTPDPA